MPARYRALVLPTDGVSVAVSDTTLVVRSDRASAQRDGEQPSAASSDEGAATAPNDWGGGESRPVPEPPAAGKTRFFGSTSLAADRYATEFKKLADEILSPLCASPGVTLKISVDIEAIAPDGFDDAKVRTFSENARTLKFQTSEFEEG